MYKLGDIGSSLFRQISSTDQTDNFKRYIAPELLMPNRIDLQNQARTSSELKKADVYSLGASIIDLIASRIVVISSASLWER